MFLNFSDSFMKLLISLKFTVNVNENIYLKPKIIFRSVRSTEQWKGTINVIQFKIIVN